MFSKILDTIKIRNIANFVMGQKQYKQSIISGDKDMDARAFADFLVKTINDNLKSIENQLVEGNFTTVELTQRAVGQRFVLSNFAKNMDAILNAFYEEGSKDTTSGSDHA